MKGREGRGGAGVGRWSLRLLSVLQEVSGVINQRRQKEGLEREENARGQWDERGQILRGGKLNGSNSAEKIGVLTSPIYIPHGKRWNEEGRKNGGGSKL